MASVEDINVTSIVPDFFQQLGVSERVIEKTDQFQILG